MREDTGLGLTFLVSVGEWAAVPCPVAAGLLAVAGAVAGDDFRSDGRTMESLDLMRNSIAEVKTMLEVGL